MLNQTGKLNIVHTNIRKKLKQEKKQKKTIIISDSLIKY